LPVAVHFLSCCLKFLAYLSLQSKKLKVICILFRPIVPSLSMLSSYPLWPKLNVRIAVCVFCKSKILVTSLVYAQCEKKCAAFSISDLHMWHIFEMIHPLFIKLSIMSNLSYNRSHVNTITLVGRCNLHIISILLAMNGPFWIAL
jgi:hypothetical protein